MITSATTAPFFAPQHGGFAQFETGRLPGQASGRVETGGQCEPAPGWVLTAAGYQGVRGDWRGPVRPSATEAAIDAVRYGSSPFFASANQGFPHAAIGDRMMMEAAQ